MIQQIEDSTWKSFLKDNQSTTFLQSIAWRNFYASMGYQTFVCGQYSDNLLISTALVIHVKARRGDHLLVPHGPVGPVNKNTLREWREFWYSLAKKHGCSFVRWQPVIADSQEHTKLANDTGFRAAPLHAHTEHTSVVDIHKSEKDILMNMRKTTRQMIRKGIKLVDKGEVTVTFPAEIDDEMAKVYQDTYVRGGAVAYSDEYIRKEWQAFADQTSAQLVNVYYEGSLLSWGMFIYNGVSAFYHQGGNHLNKKIPSSYICQWTGIKEALKRGCTSYDFWGVTPPDSNKNHPWKNISQFKRGFGGHDVSYLKAQDIVTSWKYWPTWILETYRAQKRGFK